MNEPGTVERATREPGRATVIAMWAAVVLVVVALEERVAELDRRAAAADQRADAESRRAEEAEERAALAAAREKEAATASTRAEQERQTALEAQRAAENEAEFARREAERARDVAEDARAEAERIRAERDAELDRLQDTLGEIVETRRTALGVVMNLGEDAINFEFDKADLAPEDRELLSRIVGVLLTSDGYRVQVFGHTDDVGDEAYNQALSERRATAVSSYLVEAGIDPAIIVTRGLGEARPLLEGTDATARARNRRVEIGIIDTVVDYSGSGQQRRR